MNGNFDELSDRTAMLTIGVLGVLLSGAAFATGEIQRVMLMGVVLFPQLYLATALVRRVWNARRTKRAARLPHRPAGSSTRRT